MYQIAELFIHSTTRFLRVHFCSANFNCTTEKSREYICVLPAREENNKTATAHHTQRDQHLRPAFAGNAVNDISHTFLAIFVQKENVTVVSTKLQVTLILFVPQPILFRSGPICIKSKYN